MFYDNLKTICAKRNIKITNLVKELGISSGNMSRWRNGTVPKADTLTALALRLDVSVDDLLYKDKKPTPIIEDGLDDVTREIMNIVKQLSPEHQNIVLAQIKALAQMEK